MTITSEQAVDAVNEVFGRHPGYRALHAKGTLCKGTFTAMPDAAGLTQGCGAFKEEALDVEPGYSPETANADGWAATRLAWLGLAELDRALNRAGVETLRFNTAEPFAQTLQSFFELRRGRRRG